jgi:predicted SAM-dependent methyltransferase
MKLDIACGQNKAEGFTGIDMSGDADIIHDLTTFPWPIEDESVEEARCIHFFEHLSGEQAMKFMDELHRILNPGAGCLILCPYYNNMRAIQDPTHKQYICEATFLYYNKVWREQNKLDHYPIKADFNFSYAYHMDTYWAMRNEEARAFALKHYTNVVNDIQINLVKI